MEGDTTVKSVLRATTLMKVLASEAAAGWRLSDVARRAGLGKATTHRLLAALVDAGFVYQAPENRRYYLGYEIVRLGNLATRYDMARLARPALLRLARETGDTVFISVREGRDALCLEREVGDYPIKTLTLEVGDRRPLGVGAGSLALLASLPDEEVAEIIAANEERLKAYPGFHPDELEALVARTRAMGHAFNDGRVVKAMCAIGVPILDARGSVVAAVSVAAIRERMSGDRVEWLLSQLKREAATVQARLSEDVDRAAPRTGPSWTREQAGEAGHRSASAATGDDR